VYVRDAPPARGHVRRAAMLLRRPVDLFGDRRLVRRPSMDLDRSDGEDDDDTQAAKGVRAAPMQPKTRNDRCM